MAHIDKLFLKCYVKQPFLIQKKVQYLLRFSLFILLICLIGILLGSGMGESLFYVLGLVSFLAVIASLAKGNLSTAIWLTVIMVSVDILCDVALHSNSVSYEKIVETIMESFLSYILVGFVSVNRRQIIYTILTNTAFTVMHAFLIIHFAYSITPIPSPAYRYFIGGTAAVFLAGLITLSKVAIHEEAITMVERQKQALSVNNKQLEEMVSTRTRELEIVNARLEKVNQDLTVMSMYDQLTGIPNRRQIYHEAEEALARSDNDARPVCIAMLDIDHFKRINDTYGHVTGDLALKTLVSIMKTALRSTGTIGRIGGEEFLIILDNTTKETSFTILTDLKNSVERTPIYLSEDHTLHLTVSIGFNELTENQSLKEIIQQADEALYYSKTQGRNQITMYPDVCSLTL